MLDRIFVDCDIPEMFLEPCIRLYCLFTKLRRNVRTKFIDEVNLPLDFNNSQDYIILGILFSLIKLFYGLDDQAYSIFLSESELEELAQHFEDEQVATNFH
jgi:hypothetical protein